VRDELVDMAIALSVSMGGQNTTDGNVATTWRILFMLYAKRLGFRRRETALLLEFGKGGHNWSRLHPTEEESAWGHDQRLAHFASELHYVSDRMTLDRLLRTNWYYNHWLATLPE